MTKKKDELARIKQELTARKRELEEVLTTSNKERVTDDQVQDPGDQALTSTLESLKTSLQTVEAEEYRRVSRALEKIEAGTYGICTDCNQPISEKRLRSYPDAGRCLACQEQFEDKERS